MWIPKSVALISGAVLIRRNTVVKSNKFIVRLLLLGFRLVGIVCFLLLGLRHSFFDYLPVGCVELLFQIVLCVCLTGTRKFSVYLDSALEDLF